MKLLTRSPRIVACEFMQASQRLVFDLSELDLGAEGQEEVQDELSKYFSAMLAEITLPKAPGIDLSGALMTFEVVVHQTPLRVEIPLRVFAELAEAE